MGFNPKWRRWFQQTPDIGEYLCWEAALLTQSRADWASPARGVWSLFLKPWTLESISFPFFSSVFIIHPSISPPISSLWDDWPLLMADLHTDMELAGGLNWACPLFFFLNPRCIFTTYCKSTEGERCSATAIINDNVQGSCLWAGLLASVIQPVRGSEERCQANSTLAEKRKRAPHPQTQPFPHSPHLFLPQSHFRCQSIFYNCQFRVRTLLLLLPSPSDDTRGWEWVARWCGKVGGGVGVGAGRV